MTTMSFQGTLVVVTCWCGMRHAVPEELDDVQQRQHRDGENQTDIYCPLGHCHIRAGKGEAARERQRREQAEARAKAIQDQLDAETRSHSATKGQLTKAKKRVGKGTCPCCNRHFTNVERHMATKHPDYAEETA